MIQFYIGGLFFISIILLVFQEPYVFSFFYDIIFSSRNNEMSVYFIRYVNYFYVIGLCYYFSGILLILISDYLRGDKIM